MATESQKTSIRDVEELDELLSEPTEATIRALAALEGDIVILGVGGKMGPTLARMAKRASEAAGIRRRVIGVSRFSSHQCEHQLQAWGVETVRCDLLDSDIAFETPGSSQRRVHGGYEVRLHRTRVADLGHEQFFAGARRREISSIAGSRHFLPATFMDFARFPSKDRARAIRSIPWANMQ